ncbi:MAG: hypothetical protein MRQ09_01830 [Candidatus Midichloria sp.]|nr:hypothetical protein [Candidatus Midichloria sp.]
MSTIINNILTLFCDADANALIDNNSRRRRSMPIINKELENPHQDVEWRILFAGDFCCKARF